ncbi:MAG: hypothetical protein WBD32_07740 [Acidobacteriaceae bacterium]
MLEQFLPGRGRIARHERTKVSHLPQNEIADVREVGVDGILASRQKLVGEFPHLLLALVDRFDQERRRASFRSRRSQPA